jgi:MFS family permease
VPVGRLSDRFDRRIVLAALCIGFAFVAIVLVYLPRSLPMILPAAAALGGFMSTLYPVCVAHAHDRMPGDRVIAVTGRLILVSGCASVVGPVIGTILMRAYGIDGVLYLLAVAAVLLASFAAAGSMISTSPAHRERSFEILAPQASVLAHDPLGSPDECGPSDSRPRSPESLDRLDRG